MFVGWPMFYLRYLCPVYHMLQVSLDCPFLNGPSVFSNGYASSMICVFKVLHFSNICSLVNAWLLFNAKWAIIIFLLSHGETKLHFDEMMMTSPFNKTKGVIRNRKSNDRQHNGQKKKYNRTNNNLQNIHIKLKME